MANFTRLSRLYIWRKTPQGFLISIVWSDFCIIALFYHVSGQPSAGASATWSCFSGFHWSTQIECVSPYLPGSFRFFTTRFIHHFSFTFCVIVSRSFGPIESFKSSPYCVCIAFPLPQKMVSWDIIKKLFGNIICRIHHFYSMSIYMI